jgi:hypothetical protein
MGCVTGGVELYSWNELMIQKVFKDSTYTLTLQKTHAVYTTHMDVQVPQEARAQGWVKAEQCGSMQELLPEMP